MKKSRGFRSDDLSGHERKTEGRKFTKIKHAGISLVGIGVSFKME